MTLYMYRRARDNIHVFYRIIDGRDPQMLSMLLEIKTLLLREVSSSIDLIKMLIDVINVGYLYMFL